ncbi:MAG: hypothetical protein Q8O55_01350 [Dehalococcoidales bacterium]|nr:hypothetical protein [Dehalococcoidales bacterium]
MFYKVIEVVEFTQVIEADSPEDAKENYSQATADTAQTIRFVAKPVQKPEHP